jgi:hypothetical protein
MIEGARTIGRACVEGKHSAALGEAIVPATAYDKLPIMLAFLLAATAVAAPVDTVTAGVLEHATPAQLAAMLLPPADAARIVGGRIHLIAFTLGYTVEVWGRSVPVAPTVCRRPVHTRLYFDQSALGRYGDPSVVLISVTGTETLDSYATTYPVRATPERCAALANYLDGPPQRAEPIIHALTRITEAMRAAAAPGPLPFALRCRDDHGERPCTNERTALASLPLGALVGVAFNPDHRAPSGAPPAGPGEPDAPTMEFGMSAPHGESWFVTLIGSADGLRQVVMRRTMVIYH